MNSETPRTDKETWDTIAGAMRCEPNTEHAYVPATFARQLERELSEANGKIKEASYNCPSCGRHDFGLYNDLWQKLDVKTKERDALHGSVMGLIIERDQLKAIARELAGQLDGIYEYCCGDIMHNHSDIVNIARMAHELLPKARAAGIIE